MASSEAARFEAQAIAPSNIQPAAVIRTGHNVALGYLRGFLVVLVLAHHSVIAYVGLTLPQSKSFAKPPFYWRAFPVIDHAHWAGFGLFTAFNDDFFMSLMFFVSGLFVWSSLRRKGKAIFARDRLLRLGIPFLFAAAIVAPLAYYPSYLLAGAHGVSGYIHAWLGFGDWPTGPAWFVFLLLAFDLCVAALYAIARNFGDTIGRLVSNAHDHPVRFFVLLAGASAVAYTPMVMIFGPMAWTSVGPFQFQTARLFHYAVYFLIGIGVGAYGIDRGLLAPDGTLAQHWGRWTIWALVAFALSVVLFVIAISKGKGASALGWSSIGGIAYAITCAAISMAFLALFVRFATRRFWIFDSLSANEYGMYLIHYMFVSWLQFALLSLALPAIPKAVIVFAGTLLLSWGTSAALRNVPAVRRIV
jgi:hypothetical protein